MADVILQAEPRTQLGSRNAGRIRREGLLPGRRLRAPDRFRVGDGLGPGARPRAPQRVRREHADHAEARGRGRRAGPGPPDPAAPDPQRAHPRRLRPGPPRRRGDRRDPADHRGRAAGREGRRDPRAAVLHPHRRGAARQHPDLDRRSTSPTSRSATSSASRTCRSPPGVAVQHEPDELVAQVSIPRGLTEEEEAAEAALEAEGEAEGGEEGAAEGGAADGGGEASED